VGRLRDFFRTGTTRLEPVTVESLLESARRIGTKLEQSGDVAFRVETDAGASVLLVDRLQIDLVLRNLIANAFEAMRMCVGDKRVTVSAHEVEGNRILFRIMDTGPGVSPSARKLLFEPFSTTKPTGMGLGLAISRAIAEAHGGSLMLAHTEHGEFDLVLPGVATDE